MLLSYCSGFRLTPQQPGECPVPSWVYVKGKEHALGSLGWEEESLCWGSDLFLALPRPHRAERKLLLGLVLRVWIQIIDLSKGEVGGWLGMLQKLGVGHSGE